MALEKYAICKGMLKMVPKRCSNFQFPYGYKFILDLKNEVHNVPQKSQISVAGKTITSNA